jgi:hypothetical protein
MWHICSKKEFWNQEKQPLLGNRFLNRQQYQNHRSATWAGNNEELSEAVFSVRSVSSLYNGDQLLLLESLGTAWKLLQLESQLVRQLGACQLGSKASQELTAEVGGWQLEVSPARELAAEESTG